MNFFDANSSFILQIVQIIAFFQGIFLIAVLIKNKSLHKSSSFWLLLGSIFSIVFYVISDSNFLFMQGSDWVHFDLSLFITFLFLFVKYRISEKTKFNKYDLLFFIPNIIYFGIEIAEVGNTNPSLVIEIPEIIIHTIFIAYLLYATYQIIKVKKQKWIIYFVVAITLIMSASLVKELETLFGYFPHGERYNSYILIVVAFLFYFIAFKLNIAKKEVLPTISTPKYKTSGLKPELASDIKKRLIDLMEEKQFYKDRKLSIFETAKELNVPKQYISEVLNVHLNISFQDFINQYRVEAFIDCLKQERYDNYTLIAIANEVGFNSKTTFNTTFKRIKGVTPLEFKNNLGLSLV
jgi:AraC-like DNA-binding protein